MELATGNKHSPAERLILDALKKKGAKAFIKVYKSERNRAPSIYEIMPEDGEVLDPEQVLEELDAYIENEKHSVERFYIKVRNREKDSGTLITVSGAKKHKNLSGYNKSNSGSFGSDASMFSLFIAQMKENRNLDTQFQKFRNEVVLEYIKRDHDSQRASLKAKLKKEKKKRKKKKKHTMVDKVMGSPAMAELSKGLIGRFFGDPAGDYDFPAQTPIETQFANIAGPPISENQPTNKKSDIYNNEEVEVEEISDAESLALDGFQLLEKAGFKDAGLLVYTICHWIVKNKGTMPYNMLMPQLEAHKKAVLKELHS